MASRRVKVAGVALGLLAGLAGGLFGYRAYALRKQAAAGAPAAAAVPGGEAQGAPAATAPAPAPRPEPVAGDAPEPLTPAEREARLVARLDAAAPAPAGRAAPPHGGAKGQPSPRPGSPAAREAELMRRAAEGQLPAAAQPLVRLASIAAISAEGRAQADSLTQGRAAEEERRAILSVWPPIAEAEPPPGPHLPAAKPPKPRPPRLELPSQLDQWGE